MNASLRTAEHPAPPAVAAPGGGVLAAPASAGGSLQDRAIVALVLVLAALATAPLVALAVIAANPAQGVWGHLATTVLPGAVATTFALMLGVGLVTVVIGVGTAWLTAAFTFPGRRFFAWALLLPLAVPTYIVAYTAVEVMDFTGPLQTAIRAITGAATRRDYWFPQVRSLPGAILVLGLVLYPYVYLSARAAFLLQSATAIEVARTLGAGPWRVFLRVALPLARPAIAVGVSLALMECLNDIGAVQFFGVRTLTVSIYDTWLNRGSLAGAAQIACAMLVVVLALVLAERGARRGRRFAAPSTRHVPLVPVPLKGVAGLLAALACALPVGLGFLVPAGVLLDSALRRTEQLTDPALHAAAWNSLSFALIAAVVTLAAGVAIAYAVRLRPRPLVKAAASVASIGYAVPGTVLAVGIFVPLAALDNAVDGMMRQLFGLSTGLLLAGSGAGLVYAYAARFMAMSVGSVEAGFAKLSPHLDMAARTLGRGALGTLRRVLLPLMRPALATAALLVFVDTMKELPATILLKPFNFETLASLVYAAASREHFEESALAALVIVLVGLLPVVLLARTTATVHR
jgi:iron(III) transport system permease protein